MTKTTQYKNTPIGPIPTEWEVKKLGENIDVYRGGSPRPIQNFITTNKNGVNWIKIGDTSLSGKFIQSAKEKIIPEGEKRSRKVFSGDFLLSNSMSFGRPYILQIDGCIHDGWLVLQNYKDTFDKDFLYYILSSEVIINQYKSRAAGSSVLNLNKELVSSVKLIVPPLPEQQKIAEVLSTWDKAIQETDAIIKKLQDRNKALANKLFEENNWQINKLSDLFERITDKNKEGNTTVTTISAKHGFIRQEDFFNKTVASKDLSNYYLINKGDFCYNKSYSKDYDWGVVKRLNDFEKAVVTTLYICFRFKDNSQNSDFWELYFENKILDKGLSKVAQEGGRAHGLLNVTSGDFFSIKVKVPSLEEQNAIAEILNTANQELKQYQEKLTQLKQQKKGLMQQLLTGKVRTV